MGPGDNGDDDDGHHHEGGGTRNDYHDIDCDDGNGNNDYWRKQSRYDCCCKRHGGYTDDKYTELLDVAAGLIVLWPVGFTVTCIVLLYLSRKNVSLKNRTALSHSATRVRPAPAVGQSSPGQRSAQWPTTHHRYGTALSNCSYALVVIASAQSYVAWPYVSESYDASSSRSLSVTCE